MKWLIVVLRRMDKVDVKGSTPGLRLSSLDQLQIGEHVSKRQLTLHQLDN
jgi:hypothetical protein